MRVVVTGIGLILPTGTGKEAAWQALCAGHDGASDPTTFDASSLAPAKVAEVKDMTPLRGRKSVWAVSRGMIMGFAAARLALEDAAITVTSDNRNQIGVVYGSTLTGLAPLARYDQEALRNGPRIADPAMFPSTGSSAPACQASIVLGLDAFNATLSNGETASLDAIQYGMQFMTLGRATTVLAGGVEDLCFERYFSFHTHQLLADGTAMPFDSRRTGLLMGEGSAVLVLENREQAEKRGARIYAEMAGYSACLSPAGDATGEIKAAAQAMEGALEQASMTSSQVSAIFVGANGSRKGDSVEALALSKAFDGELPPVTALKSMIGDSYSASGAIQAAAGALALHHQTMPGTIHFAQPDPSCPMHTIVSSTHSTSISSVMINTFGSKGNCASLILKAYEN